MRGIDLSHWNGSMGNNILQNEEVELDFVILKHSEGATVKDTMFDQYKKLADDRGLLVGGYHFYVGTDTSEERNRKIADLCVDMVHKCDDICWIDWEREITPQSFKAIQWIAEEVYKQTTCRLGLYASYSVFERTDLTPDNVTLAKVCESLDMPIWCARYKYNLYRQAVEYGINNVDTNKLQREIDGVKVHTNQIVSKCYYKGNPIDLDYNVRYKR